jgi:hypothetical protein
MGTNQMNFNLGEEKILLNWFLTISVKKLWKTCLKYSSKCLNSMVHSQMPNP